MRRGERKAWTEFCEGRGSAPSKYNNVRTNGYASKYEAKVAADLEVLERAGKIRDLRKQVPFILIPANGKLRAVKYVADFVYYDNEGLYTMHVVDAKGFKTPVYRLKKRLFAHVFNMNIEEV
jgi:hypothetical protein